MPTSSTWSWAPTLPAAIKESHGREGGGAGGGGGGLGAWAGAPQTGCMRLQESMPKAPKAPSLSIQGLANRPGRGGGRPPGLRWQGRAGGFHARRREAGRARARRRRGPTGGRAGGARARASPRGTRDCLPRAGAGGGGANDVRAAGAAARGRVGSVWRAVRAAPGRAPGERAQGARRQRPTPQTACARACAASHKGTAGCCRPAEGKGLPASAPAHGGAARVLAGQEFEPRR